MPGINEGKNRRELAVNKDKWILFKMTRFDLLLKKVNKIPLVKKLTVRQLKVDVSKDWKKKKKYLSVLLLMIKMSQTAREELDHYCKILYYSENVRLNLLEEIAKKNH